jgi:hypothetical protein
MALKKAMTTSGFDLKVQLHHFLKIKSKKEVTKQ